MKVEPQTKVVQQEAGNTLKPQSKMEILYSDTIPEFVEPDSVRNTKEGVAKMSTQFLSDLFGSDVASKNYSIRITYFPPNEFIRNNQEKFVDPENWKGGYSVEYLDKTGRKVSASELAIRHNLIKQLGAEEAFKINIVETNGEILLTDQNGKEISNIDLSQLTK